MVFVNDITRPENGSFPRASCETHRGTQESARAREKKLTGKTGEPADVSP